MEAARAGETAAVGKGNEIRGGINFGQKMGRHLLSHQPRVVAGRGKSGKPDGGLLHKIKEGGGAGLKQVGEAHPQGGIKGTGE